MGKTAGNSDSRVSEDDGVFDWGSSLRLTFDIF